ncbi:ABC transporter permease [Psychromicrobium lacuslunae]|uniref:ABC transporter permease n=1 Tax=Psychromicrobium lacuslunae TaxID=1618207 RepID=A0A0D4BW76_9MICC|nr:ABC transporter permease [Psychromicrobium lacuslunae]AJT40385.1 ABC transporter permease [Psychromicrobium lacuslunae]
MSTVTPSRETAAQSGPRLRNWKTPIALGVLALAAIIAFAIFGANGSATFRLSQDQDVVQLAPVAVSAKVFGWIFALICAACAVMSYFQVKAVGNTRRWVTAIFAVSFVLGFMVWIVGGTQSQTVSLVGMLTGSMLIVVPIVFGSLSGVLSERAGVVNIAIEGQLLAGAFTAALVGTMTGNPFVALIAAALAGVVVSLILAVFSIKYVVNQIIVGVVLNVLVSGLTGFLFDKLMKDSGAQQYNQPPHLSPIGIPLLKDIPVIGPMFFDQSILGYIMLVLVFGIWFALFKTKWGLRVRAVGEHPQAADTVGIKVNKVRFWNVTLGGVVAGIGGSYFTLVAVSSFSKEMSGGLGFIALAAVIFGRWNPIGAFLAALLFGVAGNLQNILSIAVTPVDGAFLAMLPYALTILAVAGLVGKSRAPAADGEPYVKG